MGCVDKQVFTAVWKLESSIGVPGQEPQTGLLLSVKGELALKPCGSELKLVAHHPDMSWLKTDPSNI